VFDPNYDLLIDVGCLFEENKEEKPNIYPKIDKEDIVNKEEEKYYETHQELHHKSINRKPSFHVANQFEVINNSLPIQQVKKLLEGEDLIANKDVVANYINLVFCAICQEFMSLSKQP
jgi:hypothetical protein